MGVASAWWRIVAAAAAVAEEKAAAGARDRPAVVRVRGRGAVLAQGAAPSRAVAQSPVTVPGPSQSPSRKTRAPDHDPVPTSKCGR